MMASISAWRSPVNAEIESWIRRAPEMWLWLHRRWPIRTNGGNVGQRRQGRCDRTATSRALGIWGTLIWGAVILTIEFLIQVMTMIAVRALA